MRALPLFLMPLVVACPAPAPVSGPPPQTEPQYEEREAVVREAPKRPSASPGEPATQPSPDAKRPTNVVARVPLEVVQTRSDLPPSTRAFAVALDDGGPNLVLGTWESTLWARRLQDEDFVELWTSKGPGAVQEVIAGELGGAVSLFTGRGRARGNLIDFVRVDRIDPRTGAVRPLLREESERADIAQLVMTREPSGVGALVVGYFETKHRVAVRRLLDDGAVARGDEQLMATSRVFVDLDGDGTPDEVVGRVYRDDQASPGDLTARIGERSIPIETQGGVRALAVARWVDDGEPTLYFADGWSANYGAEGRAKLARARLRQGQFEVERLAESPGEYTFFSIFVVPSDDHDHIFVQGSGHLSVLERDERGDVAFRRLLSFEHGAGQGALGRGPKGTLWWYWPGDEATTATKLAVAP